ncbi:MAG: hypothetical protein WAS34_16165 [Thiolinea sp.]
MLIDHLNFSANSKGKIVDILSNELGNFEIRESLFIRPSGNAARFNNAFQRLENGTRRPSTVIPKH